jgi:hypothetical protein
LRHRRPAPQRRLVDGVGHRIGGAFQHLDLVASVGKGHGGGEADGAPPDDDDSHNPFLFVLVRCCRRR